MHLYKILIHGDYYFISEVALTRLIQIGRFYGWFSRLRKEGSFDTCSFCRWEVQLHIHPYLLLFQQYIATSTCQKPQLTVNGWETEETGKNIEYIELTRSA